MSRTRDGIDRRIRALLEAGAVGDLGDGRLLERFTPGDGESAEAAFAALVERHGTLVWRVCRSILADPNDADDAFQATFLALVRRSRTLWVRDSLGPWLLRVARRTALRARDRARRRRLREQAAAGSRPTSAEPRPLDDLAAIHEEIARLPERYRSVVVLCLLQGLRDEQAAARLGWPVGTVHSRLARGRERLRASLTRRGLAPSAALLAASRLPVPAEAASSAVPPHLVEATARAASLLVADGLRSAAVPIAVASLVEGAARMSWIANVKSSLAAALLGGAALATALGSPGHGPAEAGPPAPAESRATSDEKPTAPSPDLPAYPGVVLTSEGDPAIRGMGTIIASREDESIILTAGSLFAPGGPFGQVDPSKPRPTISVTLSTSLRYWLEPGPGFTQEVHRAELVVFDSVRDLGLLRIRPGRALPTARIVGPDWSPPATAVFEYFDTIGPMWAPFAGCRVLDEKLVRSREGVNQSIETARALKADHIGTGLFHRTRSGEHTLAGVYNAEVPRADGQAAGVFAGPAMIHHILAANGLKALIPDDQNPEPQTSAPIPPPRSHPSWSTVKIQADNRDRNRSSEDDGRWILGSIISNTPEESLILTSGRALDPGDGRRQITIKYPDPTTPGDLPRPDRHDTVAGELIARDTNLDLAAIRVRPGVRLPVLRIAPPDRVLVEAQELLRTVWVEDGTTALRYTAVAKADEPLLGSGQPNYRGTWCFGPPMPRDLGAPLVRRRDGSGGWEIVGVCNGGTHENSTGYYASPASIGRFLEKLAILKVDLPSLAPLLSSPGGAVGPTAASPAAQDASRPTNTSILPAADSPPAVVSPTTVHPPNLEALPGQSATPLVRIALGGAGGASGFGVVIRSGAGRSLALTACRLVAPDGLETPAEDVRVTVSAGPDEVYAEPAPAGATFSARVVARDAARNLALLAFDAGRVLPTSEIAPRDWNPNDAVRELTVYKLDEGGHLAAKRRKIVDPDVRGRMGEVEYSAIECEGAPKLDELGMPLDYGVVAEGRPRFVTVGICNYSDAPTQTRTADAPPKPTTGLFASPEMIHQFLEAHDLAGLVPSTPAEVRRPAPARPFERLTKPRPKPASGGVAGPAIPISEAPKPRKPDATQIVGERLAAEQERLDRLDAQVGEIGRKLDRLLDALKAPASGR